MNKTLKTFESWCKKYLTSDDSATLNLASGESYTFTADNEGKVKLEK